MLKLLKEKRRMCWLIQPPLSLQERLDNKRNIYFQIQPFIHRPPGEGLLWSGLPQFRLLLHIQTWWWDFSSLSSRSELTNISPISVSQYEFGTEDSINYSSRDPYTSDHIPDKDAIEENSFSRSSEQMPDLTSSANIIFDKELSGSESCNWYLLKKLGDNNSNFSSYKPSIHRTGPFFNGARIEGICGSCCCCFYNQYNLIFRCPGKLRFSV